jgi:phage/conjugal plasmid C-4 type zinc finger TraR family protein
MADIADRAYISEMGYLQDCLAAAHEAAEVAGVSLTHCEICGERIPEARRVAVPGVRLCIECQEELERGW